VIPARFKIDEDLPAEIGRLLHNAGHDASSIVEQRMVGWTDDHVWAAVVAERRSRITADVGFADARRVAVSPAVGIVLLRAVKESRREYVRMMADVLASFPLDQVPGCVVTVTPEQIRVHDTRHDR